MILTSLFLDSAGHYLGHDRGAEADAPLGGQGEDAPRSQGTKL